MKRRIALLAVVAVAAAMSLSIVGAAGAASGSTQATKPVQKVTVLMYDFRFKFSKPKLKAGKTHFTVINRGKSIHDFDITRVHQMPFIQPGKTYKFTVTLKPGKFHYVCTVPRHDQLGMTGELTVVKPIPA